MGDYSLWFYSSIWFIKRLEYIFEDLMEGSADDHELKRNLKGKKLKYLYFFMSLFSSESLGLYWVVTQ